MRRLSNAARGYDRERAKRCIIKLSVMHVRTLSHPGLRPAVGPRAIMRKLLTCTASSDPLSAGSRQHQQQQLNHRRHR